MIVRAQFARLRQTEWWEYALRFAFGGAVTVVTGLIAKELGAAIGGLFLAFPGIFPSSVTLVERHERMRKQRLGLQGRRRGREVSGAISAGAVMGALALLAFAALAWLLFARLPAWQAISLATLAWLAAAAVLWWLRFRFRACGR